MSKPTSGRNDLARSMHDDVLNPSPLHTSNSSSGSKENETLNINPVFDNSNDPCPGMTSRTREIDAPVSPTTSTHASGRGKVKNEREKEKESYSVYTRKEKWFIVLLIAFSGLFSPLTVNVYFPAILIADAFNKPTLYINLTVTMYMVFQGISPMFFGTLSNHFGRRIIYISCLAILSLSCIGLALVPTNAYWLLIRIMNTRFIGDIAEPIGRGGFMGIYEMGPLASHV